MYMIYVYKYRSLNIHGPLTQSQSESAKYLCGGWFQSKKPNRWNQGKLQVNLNLFALISGPFNAFRNQSISIQPA